MRVVVNAFIIFHLFVLGLWSMPGSTFRTHLARHFEGYVIRFGFWHVWDMFAPMPLMTNFRCEAQITYKDGSHRIWEFPQMEKLGMIRRIPAERYRKWVERVRQDSYSVVWNDTARWIARQNNFSPTNPPVWVSFTRYWAAIPPPQPRKDYQPIPEKYDLPNHYTFFNYNVRPEDLK